MGTTADNMESAGRLTTHVLDTMHGKPAAGLAVTFSESAATTANSS